MSRLNILTGADIDMLLMEKYSENIEFAAGMKQMKNFFSMVALTTTPTEPPTWLSQGVRSSVDW